MTRASFEETLAFANAVREAGGGNPLDALMPAVPQDQTACLIAANLNFNCEVNGCVSFRGESVWAMVLIDKTIRNKIAAKLGLAKVNLPPIPREPNAYAVILPTAIGQVADDFDAALDEISDWVAESKCGNSAGYAKEVDVTLIKEMWPYIEASTRETAANGTINDKGELIL